MSSPIGSSCEIVVATTMSEAWSSWFEDFEVTTEGGASRLVGHVADQSALHGILGRLRDLGIPILDVHVSRGSAPLNDV